MYHPKPKEHHDRPNPTHTRPVPSNQCAETIKNPHRNLKDGEGWHGCRDWSWFQLKTWFLRSLRKGKSNPETIPWGPANVESLGRKKYYHLFQDEAWVNTQRGAKIKIFGSFMIPLRQMDQPNELTEPIWNAQLPCWWHQDSRKTRSFRVIWMGIHNLGKETEAFETGFQSPKRKFCRFWWRIERIPDLLAI